MTTYSHLATTVSRQTGGVRAIMLRVAITLAIVVSSSTLTTQASFADVRDVNRTAGETVDTVLAPEPQKPSKPAKESKPLTCGVIFGILLC